MSNQCSLPTDIEVAGDTVIVAACGSLILHDDNLRLLKEIGAVGGETEEGDAIAWGMIESLRNVAPYLRAADLSLLNLEMALSGATINLDFLRSVTRALAVTGFSIAGKHALDNDGSSRNETVSIEGPLFVDCTVIEKRGIRVAVLTGTEAIEALSIITTAGPIGVIGSTLVSQVAAVRKTGIDALVVSLRWGEECAAEPTQEQRALARDLFLAGADVVIGHQPSVLQRIEKFHVAGKDRLCFYSLGPFCSQLQTRETRASVIAYFGFQKDRQGRCYLVGPKLLPLCGITHLSNALEYTVFEPSPIQDTGAGLEALAHLQSRIGEDLFCKSERVIRDSLFEHYTSAGFSSAGAVIELNFHEHAVRARKRLAVDSVENVSNNHPAVSLSKQHAAGQGMNSFEVPRMHIHYPNRQSVFGTYFVIDTEVDVEKILAALDTAVRDFPQFAGRVVERQAFFSIHVDESSFLPVREYSSNCTIDLALSSAHDSQFRKSLCGDFPEVTSGRSACEVNIVHLAGGWILAASVLHCVSDLLGFFDFLALVSEVYRGRKSSAETASAVSVDSMLVLRNPSPMRERFQEGLPAYNFGDSGLLNLSGGPQVHFNLDSAAASALYPGFSLGHVLTVVLARTMATLTVPDSPASKLRVEVAYAVTLRKLISELRHAVGSPNCLVTIGYPSSAAILRTSVGTLLEYTRSALTAGTSHLVDACVCSPELAARVAEIGCASALSEAGPRVSGMINLSVTRLSKFRFEGPPAWFSRIRESACWEMIAYSSGEEGIIVQLGVPAYVRREQVVEAVGSLIPITLYG